MSHTVLYAPCSRRSQMLRALFDQLDSATTTRVACAFRSCGWEEQGSWGTAQTTAQVRARRQLGSCSELPDAVVSWIAQFLDPAEVYGPVSWTCGAWRERFPRLAFWPTLSTSAAAAVVGWAPATQLRRVRSLRLDLDDSDCADDDWRHRDWSGLDNVEELSLSGGSFDGRVLHDCFGNSLRTLWLNDVDLLDEEGEVDAPRRCLALHRLPALRHLHVGQRDGRLRVTVLADSLALPSQLETLGLQWLDLRENKFRYLGLPRFSGVEKLRLVSCRWPSSTASDPGVRWLCNQLNAMQSLERVELAGDDLAAADGGTAETTAAALDDVRQSPTACGTPKRPWRCRAAELG